MPDYLEAGTLNTPGIIGLGAGIKVYGKKDIANRTAVTAFNLEGYSSNQLAFKLQHDYDIQLRGGLHCAPLLYIYR